MTTAAKPPSRMLFSRKATRLRPGTSPFFQMVVFNAVSTNPLGQGLVSFTIGLSRLPRANPYIALLVTGSPCACSCGRPSPCLRPRFRGWAETSQSTRRILSPGMALGANLAQALSALSRRGDRLVGFRHACPVPRPHRHRDCDPSSGTFTNWGNDLSTAHHTTNLDRLACWSSAFLSLPLGIGTRVRDPRNDRAVLHCSHRISWLSASSSRCSQSHSSFVHTVNTGRRRRACIPRTMRPAPKVVCIPTTGATRRLFTIGCLLLRVPGLDLRVLGHVHVGASSRAPAIGVAS